jgi:hypothetical protein
MDIIPASVLTEDYRQQELAKSRRSLFYFGVGICGLAAEDEDGNPTVGEIHRDLCAFLEGRAPHHPYLRALICMARGTAKSFWVRLYLLWRCLNIVNLATLILSNSAENAKNLHFTKIMDLLTNSARSEYIRWLYRHRFPAGMEGSNSERLKLIKTDPMVDDAITYGGVETKLEGKHPDIIDVDDAEGADAKKSTLPNQQSFELVQRAIPLLRYPAQSQLIVVGTPWGRKPLVYQIRESSRWRTEADNESSSWKIFWRPIWDREGKSIWPERFPEWYISEVLSKDPIFGTQYLLLREDNENPLFDMSAVTAAAYRWANPARTLIKYSSFKFDPDDLTEDGYVRPVPIESVVPLSKLTIYLHFDPLHRLKAHRRASTTTERPTTAAIVVVGVAPDGHAFVLDRWTGDADLHGQASELLRLYRLWPAKLITWESIGAQHWLLSFVESQERNNPNWMSPVSNGRISRGVKLPRLSHRMQEGEKTTESKLWVFREILSPWLNNGALHIGPEDQRGELFRQLEGAMNEDVACDLADALAQGPAHWKPSLAEVAGREFESRRRYVDAFARRTLERVRPKWRG